MKVSIYTDGSYKKPYGGFGVVFVAHTEKGSRMRKHKSKRYAGTTNNRMEIKAIIYALENCDTGHRIDIYSDSEYSVKTINDWLPVWESKKIVDHKKNPDLWGRFIKTREKHLAGGSKLKFIWIRGHSTTELNNVADKLSRDARLMETAEMTIQCKANN